MEWLTTSTILEELRDYGNQTAWHRLADRFRLPIVRFAGRMGLGESDAEDVAQETLVEFAAAYRDGRYDPSRGRLSRWLFGIAYRQALSERRRSARRAVRTSTAMGSTLLAELPDEEAASRTWDHEWDQAVLEICLQRVATEVEPETFRAFRLAVGQDRPACEVADQLGVSVKVVYNAKHRVLKRIRELRVGLEDASRLDG